MNLRPFAKMYDHRAFSQKMGDCGFRQASNALHSHFKNYLKTKKGVSTRRLPLYFADFAWRWENGISSSPTRKVAQDIVRHIAVTDFTTVLPYYQTVEYPYIDWWSTEEGKRERLRVELFKIQYGIDREREEAIGDEAKERVVAERQARLDERAAAAGIKLVSNKERRSTYVKPKATPQLTFSMLRSS